MPSLVFDVAWLVYVNGGLLRLELAVARDEPNLSALGIFRGGCTFALLDTGIIRSLAMLLGGLLGGIPAVFVAIATIFAPYYVVDRGFGPVDALHRSAEGTRGSRGSIFLLGLLVGLVAIGVFAAAGALLIGARMLVPRLFWATLTAGHTVYEVTMGDVKALSTLSLASYTTIVLIALIVVASVSRATFARAYVVLAQGR